MWGLKLGVRYLPRELYIYIYIYIYIYREREREREREMNVVLAAWSSSGCLENNGDFVEVAFENILK